MAKLYYKYGTMNSSKTANLLMAAYNYEAQGKRVLCFKSSLDNRWGVGQIESRAGIPKREAHLVNLATDLYHEVKKNIEVYGKLYCVLVDEAQFLSAKQIKQLSFIADDLDIPVMCYGLKNTYKDGSLFEGSAALLYYADKIEEIKTVCQFCNSKAIMNLRVENGQPVYSGQSAVILGDTVKDSEGYYIQVCRKHYYNPVRGGGN